MGRPNFADALSLPDPGNAAALVAAGEEPPGPPAHGPVPPGDKLKWIYVWIIQNGPGDNRAAAAYGEEEEANPPFEGTWHVKTEMAHDSDEFIAGRPAQATAMALVVNEDDGTEVVDWWSEAIMIDPAPSTPST